MDLTGKPVVCDALHEEGSIVFHEDNKIKVSFSDKLYLYPHVFVIEYFRTEDEAINADVKAYLDQADKVKSAIDEIGEVTLDSEEYLDYVNKLFDQLTKEQRGMVDNHNKLDEANRKYRRLVKEEEEAAAAEEAELQRILKRNEKLPRMNYAFKCNYCDGGASALSVGFTSVCSDGNVFNNIDKEHRSWCSNDACLCKQYHDGKISRADLDKAFETGQFICYESTMLTDWVAFAGSNNTDGPKAGPRAIPQVGTGKLCVLTTVDPNGSGEDRYAIGAFLVGECKEGLQGVEEGYMKAKDGYTVIFTPEQARKIRFWDFFSNPNSPNSHQWGSGLYRKFDDSMRNKFFEIALRVTQGSPNYDDVVKLQNSVL